ncbi:MAG: hypothetical protein WC596_03540 [Candidatus Shapirobacteria bacterium]
MKEKIKKYWWIGILLIIWIIVVFFLKKPAEEKKSENEVSRTTPTTIIISGPTIFTGGTGPDEASAKELMKEYEQSLKDYPLADKLPYSGNGFVIDHYVARLKVAIYVEEGVNREEVVKEFDKWLGQNGFKAGSHQVEWRLKEKK